MMSKKYSGDSRHGSSSKTTSGNYPTTIRPIRNDDSNTAAQMRMYENNVNVCVKSSCVKADVDYMKTVDGGGMYVHSKQSEERAIDNKIGDGLSEEENSDSNYAEVVGRNGVLRSYDNHKKYIPQDITEKSVVSRTPIMHSLNPESLVSSEAGRVSFYDNKMIAKGRASKPNDYEKEQEKDNNRKGQYRNYCEELVGRYDWLNHLLQRGLMLSSLHDELLWSFQSYCWHNDLDVYKYSQHKFAQHGAKMFDVSNWSNEH